MRQIEGIIMATFIEQGMHTKCSALEKTELAGSNRKAIG
jgi:hypothetical protein